MGAGKEPAGRAEPSVPPVLEKKKKKKSSRSSPSKAVPETSVPATSTPAPPPETSVPEATGATPTPPPNQGPPATTPKPPPATLKITDFLKPGASRGKAADGSASSGSQPLVLHVGPAAAVVQEKPSGLLGRIVELKREGKDLGHLLPYAQKWNDADISAATRGLGKDRLPAPDPAGPRSTEEHFTRLKHAVKEFDSAWYDATNNVVSTADARKALFEELLWEHRNLAEAHSKCQALPESSVEALKAQVAALQAEKKQLIRDHQKALDAQKEISRELKDQAIQAGVRHAKELKAAESAAEARLNEALEDAGNANVVLQAGLEEATKALKTAEGKAAKAHKAAAEEAIKAQKAAEEKVARLEAEQKEYDLLVTRTDALALRLFPDSQEHAIKKVAERRALQAGENLGAPWDPYDHLVALNARVSHMRSVDRNLSEIPEVASQLFKTLWPGEVVPDTFSLISDRLKGAGRRIREWQCSAARAGADSALRVACSWYPELDALLGVREGAPTDLDPVLTAKRQDRAYHIAEYAEGCDRKGADNPVADNLFRLENIAYDPVPVNDSFPNEQLAVIKGPLPPALSLNSFPCVEEAIRVTDEFCDQYRALRREVEILQEENQRLRRMLEYYSIPITRPPPPHSDNNESLRVLVQNCQTEKLKLKEILKKREKNPPPSPPKE
ncbi:hypothetical protein QYE76_053019 [Lolium multiflorum]|uniref:Uncharacterized protein n=1 Tax=Lolium multiflorum TaxID=4521 RepID=A0AAD8SWE6_LOLMU|nr:hypothetical protein QYE76_053019 [Lolium multiflorum]